MSTPASSRESKRWGALAVALAFAVGAVARLDAEPPEAPAEPVLGAATSWDSSALDEPRVMLPAGTGLRMEPDLALSAVLLLETETELPLLERRGPWARVRFGSFVGWALAAGGVTPSAEDAARRRARTPEPAENVLATAREHFSTPPEERTFPGYRLLTDVRASALLTDLEALARGLEATYRERLGVPLTEGPAQAVVLFARSEDYERYVAADPLLRESASHGHAGNGVAVLSVGHSDREDLRALFVHELVHLLNRRALGVELPAWLDEGLADDFAYCRVSRDGRLLLGSVTGRSRVVSGAVTSPTDPLGGAKSIETSGAIVPLKRLFQVWDTPARLPIAELVALPSSTLSDPTVRPILYPLSAMLVRFLLDDEARRRDAFQQWLQEMAGGEHRREPDLSSRLEEPYETLETKLRSFVRRVVNAHSALVDP